MSSVEAKENWGKLKFQSFHMFLKHLIAILKNGKLLQKFSIILKYFVLLITLGHCDFSSDVDLCVSMIEKRYV